MVRLKATVLNDKKCAEYVWTGLIRGFNSINSIMVNNIIIINNVNIKMCTIWLDVCLSKQEMPTGAKGHADFIICSAAKSELNLDYFGAETLKKIIFKTLPKARRTRGLSLYHEITVHKS